MEMGSASGSGAQHKDHSKFLYMAVIAGVVLG